MFRMVNGKQNAIINFWVENFLKCLPKSTITFSFCRDSKSKVNLDNSSELQSIAQYKNSCLNIRIAYIWKFPNGQQIERWNVPEVSICLWYFLFTADVLRETKLCVIVDLEFIHIFDTIFENELKKILKFKLNVWVPNFET